MEWGRAKKKHPSIIHHHHPRARAVLRQKKKTNCSINIYIIKAKRFVASKARRRIEKQKIPFKLKSVHFTLLLTPSKPRTLAFIRILRFHHRRRHNALALKAPAESRAFAFTGQQQLQLKTGNTCTVWSESGKSIGEGNRKYNKKKINNSSLRELALDWKLFFT